MNERIKELAEQAGFFPERNWDHTAWHAAGHNDTLEKFAELIVRECLELVSYGGEFCSRPKLVEKIKQHFGVE